jgi:hypothetical protein
MWMEALPEFCRFTALLNYDTKKDVIIFAERSGNV